MRDAGGQDWSAPDDHRNAVRAGNSGRCF